MIEERVRGHDMSKVLVVGGGAAGMMAAIAAAYNGNEVHIFEKEKKLGKKLYITNERLKDKDTLEADSSIKKVEFFTDDNHLFVLGNSSVQILA